MNLLLHFIITVFRLFFETAQPQPVLEVVAPNAELQIAKKMAENEIRIEVQPNNKISIGKKQHTLASLQTEMEQKAKLNKDQPIRIVGHPDTSYQSIVQVIDHCRKAGIWNISFATQAPPKKIDRAPQLLEEPTRQIIYTIKVDKNGNMLADGKTQTIEDLEKRLTSLQRINKNIAVTIECHKDTKLEQVTKISKTLTQSGIQNPTIKIQQ